MGVIDRVRQSAPERAVSELDIPEMLDILYDFVEFGIPSAGCVSLETIQGFLHQHAREPQSRDAFQRFFLEHAIEAPTLEEPRLPPLAV